MRKISANQGSGELNYTKPIARACLFLARLNLFLEQPHTKKATYPKGGLFWSIKFLFIINMLLAYEERELPSALKKLNSCKINFKILK